MQPVIYNMGIAEGVIKTDQSEASLTEPSLFLPLRIVGHSVVLARPGRYTESVRAGLFYVGGGKLIWRLHSINKCLK